MADQATPASGPDSGSTSPGRCRGRGRGRAALFVILVALFGGIAGSLVTRAFGQTPWHAGAFMGGPIDATNVDQRVDRMIRHFAIEIDASVEQQARLAVIAKAAAKDLLPLRDQAQAARKDGLALLAAPSIDRAAIERLRSTQLALAETASKRIAQAIADAADVLTPEQRKSLTDRIAAHPWHRG
jgi:protein CpxP